MKANDFFAYEMEIGGPESRLFILRATDGAEIRRERVEPDVKHVRLFPGNGNAPTNRSARDAQVAEAAFDETQNFVAARFWLNEIRMFGVPIEERLLECGELEVEIGFSDGFRGTATVGAVVAALFEKPLDSVGVFEIGGADKFVALDAEFVPKSTPFGGHFRDEFGFGYAGFFGGALDVDAVFVSAGGHHDLVAAHALVAADGVTHDRGIRVADVRQAVRVVDRRGQVEFGSRLRHC